MTDQRKAGQAPTPVGSFFLCWQSAYVAARQNGGGYSVVELLAEHPISAEPGQFMMMRMEGGPVLPRALSVLWAQGKRVSFLVKDEGLLRARVARAVPGTPFELRGPYGVPYKRALDPTRRYILVGGGSGIAPLHYFWRRHPELVEATVFGLRTREAAEVLPNTPFVIEELGQGTASARALALWRPQHGVIACGPREMLLQLARELPSRDGVYMALEERMGCGHGACQGCVVMTRKGTLRLCKEGPLVPLEVLPW